MRYAFAVLDTDSYYIYVVNEDEAKPVDVAFDLSALPGVVRGSSAVACLIGAGCAPQRVKP